MQRGAGLTADLKIAKTSGVTAKLDIDQVTDPGVQRCSQETGQVHGRRTGQGYAGGRDVGQGCGAGAVMGPGPNQESNPVLLHCRQILYQLSHHHRACTSK